MGASRPARAPRRGLGRDNGVDVAVASHEPPAAAGLLGRGGGDVGVAGRWLRWRSLPSTITLWSPAEAMTILVCD